MKTKGINVSHEWRQQVSKNWRQMNWKHMKIIQNKMQRFRVWQSFPTRKSTEKKIMTTGLTKTHSLDLMVSVTDWMWREEAVCVPESMTEWKDRVDWKMTTRWEKIVRQRALRHETHNGEIQVWTNLHLHWDTQYYSAAAITPNHLKNSCLTQHKKHTQL